MVVERQLLPYAWQCDNYDGAWTVTEELDLRKGKPFLFIVSNRNYRIGRKRQLKKLTLLSVTLPGIVNRTKSQCCWIRRDQTVILGRTSGAVGRSKKHKSIPLGQLLLQPTFTPFDLFRVRCGYDEQSHVRWKLKAAQLSIREVVLYVDVRCSDKSVSSNNNTTNEAIAI